MNKIKYLKNKLPKSLLIPLRVVYCSIILLPQYLYWFFFDLRHSSLLDTEKSSLAGLMVTSHVLEKGLTMPNRRLGFGYERVRSIIKRCDKVIKSYSEDHVEIQTTLNDLEQYLQMHNDENFILPQDISEGVKSLLINKKTDTITCFYSTPDALFKEAKDFYEFAHSRHSVRWYSNEDIDKETIIEAIGLAQTSPSACNRQSTKVYVIESKDKIAQVLNLQNGNRGFGHLANKILLVCSDMRCWSYNHRTAAYLDAGIFTQNLLYSLHYYKICACTLNAHLSITQRKKLQNIVGYSVSEIPIVFITIGKAPDSFMIAGSQRLNVDDIYKFV